MNLENKKETEDKTTILFDKIDTIIDRLRILEEKEKKVTVTDINMNFMSMVKFMIKWAIATIPAIIILVGLGAIIVEMLRGFFRV